MKKLKTLLIGLLLMLPMASTALAATTETGACEARTMGWVRWFPSLGQGYNAVPSNAEQQVQSYCAVFISQKYLGGQYDQLNIPGRLAWNHIEKYMALKVLGYTKTYPGIPDSMRVELSKVSSWYSFMVNTPNIEKDVDSGKACEGSCVIPGQWLNK